MYLKVNKQSSLSIRQKAVLALKLPKLFDTLQEGYVQMQLNTFETESERHLISVTGEIIAELMQIYNSENKDDFSVLIASTEYLLETANNPTVPRLKQCVARDFSEPFTALCLSIGAVSLRE